MRKRNKEPLLQQRSFPSDWICIYSFLCLHPICWCWLNKQGCSLVYFLIHSCFCQDRTAILFLLFPLILLLTKNWLCEGCFPTLPVQVYQVGTEFLFHRTFSPGNLPGSINQYMYFNLYRHMYFNLYRRGSYSSIQVLLCERTSWGLMVVIYAHGMKNDVFNCIISHDIFRS